MSQIPPPPPGQSPGQFPGQVPPPPGGNNEFNQRAQQAADAARAAAQDAAGAFKTMMMDPVGSLAQAYQQLGDAKALGVGAVFGAVGAIGVAIAISMAVSAMLGAFMGGMGGPGLSFMDVLKAAIAQLVAVVGCAAGFMALAPVLGARTNLNASVFVSGAAYLAFGVAFVAAAIALKLGLGKLSMLVGGLCFLTGGCFGILILFNGWRTIFGVTDRSASLGVPGCLAISSLVSGIVAWLIG